MTNNEKNYVGTNVIAGLFSLDARRIQQLASEKIISVVKVKGVNKYDRDQVIKEYVKYLSDKIAGRIKDDKEKTMETEKMEAEVLFKKSKAKMSEIQLKELEGKMHRAEDVENLTTDLVMAIRSMMLAMPGKLAVELVNISNAAEISNRIKEEVHEMLEELSSYEYDEEAYRNKVRERQKWKGEQSEGIEDD